MTDFPEGAKVQYNAAAVKKLATSRAGRARAPVVGIVKGFDPRQGRVIVAWPQNGDTPEHDEPVAPSYLERAE